MKMVGCFLKFGGNYKDGVDWLVIELNVQFFLYNCVYYISDFLLGVVFVEQFVICCWKNDLEYDSYV